MMTWDEYEAARARELAAARAEVDAARRVAQQLEIAGAEWAALSAARGRVYRAELQLERAEHAE